jgi:hypothetical protein
VRWSSGKYINNSDILCYNSVVITKEKGDLAIGRAIHYFLSSGYEVCLPIGDKRTYDMLVETGGRIQKVQVKYAGLYSRNNQCKVGLRTTGGNQSYYYAKKYTDSEFDILFVYTAKSASYLIPWGEVKARNELSIEHIKYQKYLI